jgi:hypothetical protein
MGHDHGHAHGHSHDHGHSHGHETVGAGSMVLDIGDGFGALVIHTGPEQAELEIEISPGAGAGTPRSHNQVHARHNRHGATYSAVFPSVAAGDYTVWRPDGTRQGSVTINGGQVTEHHWD